MAEATPQTNPIESFVDTLMQETQLNALPEAVLPEYKAQLIAQVERRVGAIILGALDEQKQQEYIDSFVEPEQVDTAALNAFIEANIPDFPAKMQAGLDEFVQQFVAALNTANA